mmetsp:Transcript_92042/g.269301  ORF Transcript_92042/g.269301 Transcript_92042/m.269301 type:complete len:609 (-) Transcript_92042:45-1871(-)
MTSSVELQSSTGSVQTGSVQPALWQWEHRTGFRNYHESLVERIEAAYQRGASHVRLKTGKTLAPMELFFVDMIQHDPLTQNVRPIRRVGPDSWWQQFRRKLGGLWISIETGRPRRMTFAQYCQLQKNSVKDIDKRETTEVDLYHETGCCARIARSSWFSAATMFVVLLNSLWLGVDANLNAHATIWDADPAFQIAEHVFGAIFVVELIIRFCAHRCKRDCLRDSWFCFDAALVILMVGETWVMLPVWLAGAHNGEAGFGDLSVLRIARLLRLTKLGRVARLLRYAPEVLTMLKGLLLALRSVFVTLTLLLVLLYLFGIIFKTHAEAFPALQDKFPGVVASMWFLLLHGTFLDAVADEVPVIKDQSVFLTILFMVFIFLSSFLLLNMLIGILCEVVTSVSRREREHAAVEYLKNNLLEILEVHDKNDDRHIRKDEFELLMRNPEMHMILTNFGVDAEDLISQKEVLFDMRQPPAEAVFSDEDAGPVELSRSAVSRSTSDMQKITFAEFMELVLRLRGGNGARVKDMVDLRDYVRQRMDSLELQLPGDFRPFAGSPGPCWGTPPACGASAPQEEGMEAVMAHFAEVQKEVRDMREHLSRLEQAQRAAGSG